MSIMLTGKYNLNNCHNLLGKTIHSGQCISDEIKKLKEKILNNYLIPLYTKQWSKLNQNLFFCERIKKKLNHYHNVYKSYDLLAYIDLLKVIQILFEKFKSAETESNNHITSGKKSELASIVYKTSRVKLLPEYEIYDSILGKPKRELKEKYNDMIIDEIKGLLLLDNIDYDTIKNHLSKYIMSSN